MGLVLPTGFACLTCIYSLPITLCSFPVITATVHSHWIVERLRQCSSSFPKGVLAMFKGMDLHDCQWSSWVIIRGHIYGGVPECQHSPVPEVRSFTSHTWPSSRIPGHWLTARSGAGPSLARGICFVLPREEGLNAKKRMFIHFFWKPSNTDGLTNTPPYMDVVMIRAASLRPHGIFRGTHTSVAQTPTNLSR